MSDSVISRDVKNPGEESSRPGPEPETLKIEGDWEDAVGKALKKKKPPEGWPKPGKGPGEKEPAS